MNSIPKLKYLAQPWKLGNLDLKNRVVMGALTRNRNQVPDHINAEYYAQRSSAGLIISEGILIEPQGTEWPEAPGLWNKKQVLGWKRVTEAVHKQGGVIFAQLWHLGRVANSLHNAGIPPPAPSAIRARSGSNFRLLAGNPGYSMPEAIENPKDYITMFKKAAVRAKEAGFDGVELHAANGYLVHQFIEAQSNQRKDDYGGSIENRNRFALDAIDALLEVFPPECIGIKFNPCGGNNDMGDSDVTQVKLQYSRLIAELDSRNIGYIQLARHFRFSDFLGRGNPFDLDIFLPLFKTTLPIFNGNFSPEEADQYIGQGKASAISFGRDYIPNPDLADRLINGLQITKISDTKSYYTYPGSDKRLGYTDYPNYTSNR